MSRKNLNYCAFKKLRGINGGKKCPNKLRCDDAHSKRTHTYEFEVLAIDFIIFLIYYCSVKYLNL